MGIFDVLFNDPRHIIAYAPVLGFGKALDLIP
jgi:hypothetical protein